MKKITLLILSFICTTYLYSQTWQNYKFKAEYLHGAILEHNKHLENLVKGPANGVELGVEFQTMGEQSWHQYFNFPVVGFGAAYLDLSNPDTLGQIIAVYPYLNIPIVRTKYFILNVKPGAGISYVTKTFKDATAYNSNGSANLDRSNAAIGSHLNVYFSGGLNVEFPIAVGLSLTAECNWNHISNGSIIQPNSGINMINGFVGLKYFPNYKTYQVPEKKEIEDLTRKFSFQLTLSGGVRELYYKDDKMYPIASLAFGAYRPLANWYRMGLGVDAFYDGVFGAVNSIDADNEIDTQYKRTYIKSDEFKNKIRVGISWHHELIMGRLTAGFHFGLYLYDPVKNMEPYDKAKDGSVSKSLIYSYDIDKEDGWFYTRAVARYAITDHIFASIGLKTHLQKAEFIEWGIGYKF